MEKEYDEFPSDLKNSMEDPSIHVIAKAGNKPLIGVDDANDTLAMSI